MKNEKIDKYIYITILVLGIIAISSITYFIIFGTMNLMNSQEYYKILKDANIYQPFYKALNFISSMLIPVLIFLFCISIPYLLISIFVYTVYKKRYKQFNGEKTKQNTKLFIIGSITLFLIIYGIFSFPMGSKYEIKVNSKINDFSNKEIKEFLIKNIKYNAYVYKIEINQDWPGDFDAKIQYKDIIKKEKQIGYLADTHILTYAKDLTNSLKIKSLVILTLGNILFIYFEVQILKEFKRISSISIETKKKYKFETRKIFKNIFFYLSTYIILLIITSIIINNLGYVFLNWFVYFNIILISSLFWIVIIKRILKNIEKLRNKILIGFSFMMINVIIISTIIFICSLFRNSETICYMDNKKIIKSQHPFSFNKYVFYYDYENIFIRKKQETKKFYDNKEIVVNNCLL